MLLCCCCRLCLCRLCLTHTRPSAPCRIEWGDPFAGKAVDTFELIEDGATLTHTSDLTAAADGTRVVYK